MVYNPTFRPICLSIVPTVDIRLPIVDEQSTSDLVWCPIKKQSQRGNLPEKCLDLRPITMNSEPVVVVHVGLPDPHILHRPS